MGAKRNCIAENAAMKAKLAETEKSLAAARELAAQAGRSGREVRKA